MSPDANAKVSMMTLEAVVIRADGSREDLGTIAYWHHRWYRRLWARMMGKGTITAGGN
jgi:hypothetical protein